MHHALLIMAMMLSAFPEYCWPTNYQWPEVSNAGRSVKAIDKRPVVYVYNAPFDCPPCRQQEADFVAWEKSGKCPVRFIWNAKPKIAIAAYPATHWNGAGGKGVLVQGWYGRDRWLATWTASQKPAG